MIPYDRDRVAELRLLTIVGNAAGFPPGPPDPVTGRVEGRVQEIIDRGRQRETLGPGDSNKIYIPPAELLPAGDEEIIDVLAHYYLWTAVLAEAGMADGEHDAATSYTQAMGGMVHLMRAWDARHVKPS